MIQEPGRYPPAGQHGRMRASTADRERAIDVLKAAFSEGRLSQDEFEQRCGQVYASRTYAELAMLTGDLPAGPLGMLAQPQPGVAPPGYPVALYGARPAWPGRPPLNSLAVIAMVCALIPGFPQVGGLVASMVARRQIRETGERGDSLAIVAMVISGVGVLTLLLFFLFLAA